jgi:Calcium-activated chloride channel
MHSVNEPFGPTGAEFSCTLAIYMSSHSNACRSICININVGSGKSPKRGDIGAWSLILEFISFVSVVTNVFLLGIVSSHWSSLVPHTFLAYFEGDMARYAVMILLEHVMIAFKVLMMFVIDDVPMNVREGIAAEKSRIEENDTKESILVSYVHKYMKLLEKKAAKLLSMSSKVEECAIKGSMMSSGDMLQTLGAALSPSGMFGLHHENPSIKEGVDESIKSPSSRSHADVQTEGSSDKTGTLVPPLGGSSFDSSTINIVQVIESVLQYKDIGNDSVHDSRTERFLSEVILGWMKASSGKGGSEANPASERRLAAHKLAHEHKTTFGPCHSGCSTLGSLRGFMSRWLLFSSDTSKAIRIAKIGRRQWVSSLTQQS